MKKARSREIAKDAKRKCNSQICPSSAHLHRENFFFFVLVVSTNTTLCALTDTYVNNK